jgi:hypothetical protein
MGVHPSLGEACPRRSPALFPALTANPVRAHAFVPQFMLSPRQRCWIRSALYMEGKPTPRSFLLPRSTWKASRCPNRAKSLLADGIVGSIRALPCSHVVHGRRTLSPALLCGHVVCGRRCRHSNQICALNCSRTGLRPRSALSPALALYMEGEPEAPLSPANVLYMEGGADAQIGSALSAVMRL